MIWGLTGKSVAGVGMPAQGQSWQQNPMQQLVDGLRTQADGKSLTLDTILATAKERGLLPQDMANMTHMNLQGVTFTQTGLDTLAQHTGGQKLNLSGSDISGAVFRPASSFEGVVIDEVTVNKATNVQNVTFDGLGTQGATIPVAAGMDMSGLAIKGARHGDPSRNVTLDVGKDALVRDASVANSHYTKIQASQGADFSRLDASNARGLRVQADRVNFQGADFTGATFAPGSSMTDCNLDGVQVTSFYGVELGGSTLKGVDPRALEGATRDGQPIDAAMAQKLTGINKQVADRAAPSSTPGTDALERQLVAARNGASGMTRGGDSASPSHIVSQASLPQMAKPEAGAGLSV